VSEHRDGPGTLAGIRDRIRAHVVGRERELDLVLAAVAVGRDILLEGPPANRRQSPSETAGSRPTPMPYMRAGVLCGRPRDIATDEEMT
jgi:hypothetical protein